MNRTAINARFGAGAADRLAPLLRRYVDAVRTGGLDVRVVDVDDASALLEFGVAPVTSRDAAAIRQVVAGLDRARRDAGDRVASVTLFGGEEIFPMFHVANLVDDRRLDPDDVIPTDNVYGALTDDRAEWLAPTIPVGRICDGGALATFERVIERVIENHLQRPIRIGSCVVVNEEWAATFERAAPPLPAPIDVHLSPGYALSAANRGDADRRMILANLHGFRGQTDWMAYNARSDSFVSAMTPASFTHGTMAGSIVISSACYGGAISGRTPATSPAIAAHAEGAAAVFAATGLAFGTMLQPHLDVGGVDEFTSLLVGEASRARRAGDLFDAARRMYVRRPAGLRAFEAKTILQFILLGDSAVPVW